MANTIIKNNGYIIGTAITPFGNDPNANEIEQMLLNPPTAEDGFAYRLRADTLNWELYELPLISEYVEQITPEQALAEIMEVMNNG